MFLRMFLNITKDGMKNHGKSKKGGLEVLSNTMIILTERFMIMHVTTDLIFLK